MNKPDWTMARALLGGQLLELALERCQLLSGDHPTPNAMLGAALGIMWERMNENRKVPLCNACGGSHPTNEC